MILSVLFALITVAKGTLIVRESHVVLTQLFGRRYRLLEPGIHVLIPFAESPVKVNWTKAIEGRDGQRVLVQDRYTQIPVSEQLYDTPPIGCYLKDNKRAEINAIFTWVILDCNSAIYAIENLPLALEMLVQARLHSTCAELTFDEISRDRHVVQNRVLEYFKTSDDKSLTAWGVAIRSLELQDISLARDLRDAYEEKQRAEMKRSAELERAQSEFERMIQQQEADTKVAKMKQLAAYEAKELEAKARLVEAKSKAEADEMAARSQAEGIKVKMACGMSPDQYLEMARIEAQARTAEALAKSSGNGRLVVMPYDIASTFGTRILDAASAAEGVALGMGQK